MFDKLRVLRKQLSEKQGIAVYAIFTNAQLAEMVKKSLTCINDFNNYNGVGESKIKQYADDFLQSWMKEINYSDDARMLCKRLTLQGFPDAEDAWGWVLLHYLIALSLFSAFFQKALSFI